MERTEEEFGDVMEGHISMKIIGVKVIQEDIKMKGYNETKLRNYIEKCSRDASASENHEYDKNDCRCEWIIINYENKGYQFYPIFKFRYGRVLSSK